MLSKINIMTIFKTNNNIMNILHHNNNITPVSYTHLDVYKRQIYFYPVLIPDIKIIQVINNNGFISQCACAQRRELPA